jgi:hypothetical protein
MEIPTAVTIKNSADATKISLSTDLWKIVIEYLDNQYISRDDEFRSILPYRMINKTFSEIVLECIKEVRIKDSKSYRYDLKRLEIILSRPLSLRKFMILLEDDPFYSVFFNHSVFFNLICGCKGLQSLEICFDHGSFTTLLYRMSSEIIKGLKQIGNDCTNIEELRFGAEDRRLSPDKLPSFLKLRILSIRNIRIFPPDDMEEWMNLRRIEGNFLNDLCWASAISHLPNLVEIKCGCDVVSNQNIIDFCNICKDKPICNTLEVLDFSSDYDCDLNKEDFQGRINDDGLNSVLKTFLNLTAIELCNTDIALATTSIAQQIGQLRYLKKLNFNHSNLFFNADLISVSNWLHTSLPYFPISLEIFECFGCNLFFYGHNDDDENRSVADMIMSFFYRGLPNLREINVTFEIPDYADIESTDYGDFESDPSPSYSSDGDY